MKGLFYHLCIDSSHFTRGFSPQVALTLKYLADQVQDNRHYDCSGTLTTVAHAPRVDAQASDARAGVGGWCPEMGVDGTPDPSRSRWFSMEVTREDFPWLYC